MDAVNDDSPYYFDEETGERPILFIETFCKQSQGTIGAPLELELFQKAYIQLLFGWLEKETATAVSAKQCFCADAKRQVHFAFGHCPLYAHCRL